MTGKKEGEILGKKAIGEKKRKGRHEEEKWH